MEFPFFHMKKASAAKIQRSPRTFSKPMYGTRPCCLVQAITRHTCPDPHLGSWNCLPHLGSWKTCSHCTKWADEQHRPSGFVSRLVPDFPLPFIPTLIGLRAFDHVSSRVWWEAATNKQRSTRTLSEATLLHEARILRYRGCIHLTATSSGRFNLFFHHTDMR